MRKHPTTKTHGRINIIRKIRQASFNADFSNKLNTTLNRGVRNDKSEEFCLGQAVYFIASNRKTKEGKKWVRPGVIIRRFGNKYAFVHFMGSYFEVDIGDMRSANSLFELIGCDGTFRLRVPSTKSPIHYLADSQTLIFLTKMRNEFLNRNQTTWANADTGVNPQTFYEPDLNQRIAIRGMGGDESFNDCMDLSGIWTIRNTRKE